MADVTVAQFAEVLKVPVEKLLSQLDEAGIEVGSSEDTLSDDAKLELLTYLRRSHGQADTPAGDAAPRRITLKRKSQSELRLSGAQGRSRTVNVEVRRKRTYIKRDVLEKQAQQEQEELDRQRREEEERVEAEQREVERLQAEKETAARLEEEKRQEEEKARIDAEEEARKAAEQAAVVQAEEKSRLEKAEQDARERRAKEKEKEKVKGKAQRPETRYGRKELHVAGDKSGRRKRKTPMRRRPVSMGGDSQHGFERPTAPVVREIEIPESIAVSELAQRMAIKGNEVVKVLFNMGAMVTINQVIDQDTATLVVEEFGHVAKPIAAEAIDEKLLADELVETGEEVSRPPVVTIMGHVDHGKTSLLDYIRRTHVADAEAGGITQHIGAYSVKTQKGRVSFLDTPGHAAFTAMRARGAQATDIVVLVVAADDGVMPQTIEAIEHAKAAGVPLVIAVNKIDRENADPDRVRNELAQHEIIPEDWGGEHLFVHVSAKTGEGVDSLLDAILLQAEVMDLKAVEDGPARGLVIESSLEKGRGAVATLLVQSGTLKQGDMIIAGEEYGRIRNMFDETQQSIESAGPSSPAVVLGLGKTPNAGDDFMAVKNERKAREAAEFRRAKTRETKLAQQQASKLEDMFSQMRDAEADTISVIIKSDVHGSAEALRDALTKLSTDEVKVKVLSSGVGGITETDATLAAASNAVIIGFNVRADAAARTAIKESGVDVRYYSIIYEAIDDVKAALSGMLSPEIREQIVGLAQVKEVFSSPKFGDIAGCIVTEGLVKRSNPIRVLRENVVIYEGELESLRRFKDDVNEVRSGTECGIGVKNYADVRVGDQIECYERIEVARTLD
ncbi:MAG: translation initiation factor IF-2 [Gammaproteobacteria bacterium]|jgi:translation initiation factor IF-2|nr:translation initiation factor IF-2 [Gammaproteobacteria bacterium]MDH3863635.1 translation initiation factor IF-2 [Gammaproteobacteria bacterium]MDH3905546.1 translation initiation factor IF-2 [Gammaproteobacteria bacterium]MDH4005013.1 translation initiation factor IF-2 [Gammaproteobacteria bacterium]NCF59911.1 translation initiation factor IF-2 [Gammaproteobacteria bacterium]